MGYTNSTIWSDEFTQGVSTPYPYYTSNSLRAKSNNYWLRSYEAGDTDHIYVNTSGECIIYPGSYYMYIAPAFAIG